MKAAIRVVLVFGSMVSMAAPWAAEPVAWPAGTLDKNDPRVAAFYESRCARWADDSGMDGDARAAFMAKCKPNAAKIYPVGYGPPSAGGGE
jgi:hypothetical protein